MADLSAEVELLRLMHSATAVRIQRDEYQSVERIIVETATNQSLDFSPVENKGAAYLLVAIHTYSARVL